LFLDELDATPVNERIAMVTFSSVDSDDCSGTFVGTDSTLNAPLTTNTGNIRTAMDVMNTSIWNGGTNVEAGLHLGRTHLETTGQIANNRVIIVLTDGKFNRGLHPQDEAALAQAAGITVHTITFSEEANQADMILTAAAGGGEHYHAPDQETLEQVFRRLAGSFAILTD
jgi:Mg-chelatase subunit ChlD